MNPIAILFVLFISIPLLEIYLLIKVGSAIGAPLTIVLLVFTAVLGVWLLRKQGFSTLRRIQEALHQGNLPAMELMESALLLLAGILLLIPGFFTDAIGFVCLVPSLRRAIIALATRGELKTGRRPKSPPNENQKPRPSSRRPPSRTIEGEYTREDE